VFWHLDVFRRSYRRLSGHTCMGNSCIFCALKVIFTQFQFSDQSSLHPDALRKALAETFVNQQRFQLGHMDDAAECFENILRRIHFHIASNCHEDACTAPHCLPHQKFSLNIVEKVVCPCGASSSPLKFTEMVHYISAKALISQAKVMQETGDMLHPDRFGLLLRNANAMGDIRDCPGGCGKSVQIRRTLLNAPDVVSIGLVWDSDHPTVETTTEVARNIGTAILLQDVFHSVMQDLRTLPKLHLVGLVCYYGKHYSTFVFHSKLQVWIYFDDATVREIGKCWDDVVDKCSKGRYQPLLLLYANPNASPVTVETAPKKRTMAPGFGIPGGADDESGLDRSQESISSQHSYHRSWTPNPDSANQLKRQVLLPRARSVTPSASERENGEPSAKVFDHSRQQSFIMAMSPKPDKIKHPLRFGGQASSSGCTPGPMVDQNDGLFYHGSSGQPLSDERENYSDYTLSASGQYRRPSMEGFEPARLPLTPNIKGNERKDTSKKEPIRADVVRYLDTSGAQDTASSNYMQYQTQAYDYLYQASNHSANVASKNGSSSVTYQNRDPSNFRQRSISQNDDEIVSNMHNEGYSQHVIIKPMANSQNYDQIEGLSQSHTAVQSGLATLPRTKKEPSKDLSRTVNNQQGINGHLFSVEDQRNIQNVLGRPPPVPVSAVVGKAAEADKKGKKLTKKEMKKAEKKLRSELSRSQPDLSGIVKPYLHLSNSSDDMQQPREIVEDKITYINRSMVESILKHQGLQRNHSTHSSNSSSSAESNSIMGKLIASKKSEGGLPTDTSFDNVSIGSHKDSGYGSSDRNSSSSAGSGTVDPYIQYFISKSMVVPRNIHPNLLQHPSHQMISDFSTPKPQVYNASISHPDAQRKDLGSRAKEGRNQLLFETLTQRKVMHPIKESSQEDILKVIPKDLTPVSTPARVESPLATDALSKEGRIPIIPPKNFAAFQVSKSSHQKEPSIDSLDNDEVENDYFISMCTKADDLMDSCIIAETKGDLTGALRYCDSALGCLKEAMNQTDISNKALVYAQKKHNACLLKSRSLFKRNSSQGTEGKRSSITSSDSDNSDRPLRRAASKEQLLAASRGSPAPGLIQHGRAGSPAVKLPLSAVQQKVLSVAPQMKENKLAGPQSCLPPAQNTQASYGNPDSLSGQLDQLQAHRLRSHVARSSASDKSDTESTHSRSESNSSPRSSVSVPCQVTLASSKPVVQNRSPAETTYVTQSTSVLPMPLDSYGALPRSRHPRRTSDPTGNSDAFKKSLNKQSNITNMNGSDSVSGDGNVLKRMNQTEMRDLVDNNVVNRQTQQFGVQSHKFSNGMSGDSRQQLPDTKSQQGLRLLNDSAGHGGSTYAENNVLSNSHSASAYVDRSFPNSHSVNVSTSSHVLQQQQLHQQRSSNCHSTVSSIHSAGSSPQQSSGSVQLLQQPPQHSHFMLPQSTTVSQCPPFSYQQQAKQQNLLNQQKLEGKVAQPVSGYNQPLPGHRSTPAPVQQGSAPNVSYAAPGSSSQHYSQAYYQSQNLKQDTRPQLNNVQVNSSLAGSQLTSHASSAVSYRPTEQTTVQKVKQDVQNVMQDVQNLSINRKSSCGPPPPPPARTTSNPDFKQHLPPPTSQPQQLRYHHAQQYQEEDFKVGSGSQQRNVARIQPLSQQKLLESSPSDNKLISSGSDHGLGGQLKHATSTTGLNNISQQPRPLERYASQPDCQNLVDPASCSTKDLYPSAFAQGHTLISSANARSGDGVTKNLQLISDIPQKQNNLSIHSHTSADFQNDVEPKPNVRALASRFDPALEKPAIKPKPSLLSLLRTRSRSESGSKKPKSVLKSKKNKNSKAPRKSVTFAENISNYAAGYESAAELTSFSASAGVNDRAYFSDDDDNFKMKTTAFSDNDLDDEIEDSSNSDDIPMVRDELACHLCHKREVDMGKAYCSKCSFYMSRLVQT
ncbi:unnamed protein product, partial [Candidula unifasciata]